MFFRNVMLINHNWSNKIDPRINGHPYIILNDIDEFGEIALCLNCSSSKKGKRKTTHHIIENIKIKGYKRKSTYINIKNIYKIQIDKFIVPVGRVSHKVWDELMDVLEDNPNIN